jgi:hypothetical protein
MRPSNLSLWVLCPELQVIHLIQLKDLMIPVEKMLSNQHFKVILPMVHIPAYEIAVTIFQNRILTVLQEVKVLRVINL